MSHVLRLGRWISLLVLVQMAAPHPAAAIQGKVTLNLLRMVPSDRDARRYSDPGWGGGLQVVLPAPGLSRMFAGVAGFDIVNLLAETTTSYEGLLRLEQQTSQNYGRFYLGSEFGPHGNGALRPHVGANLALVFYWISTDVVVPDDSDRENEIRQNQRDENKTAFGYDVNAGLDINPWNRVVFDVGVRYIKSFNVPQQLGAGSVAIDPSYVQAYVGVGVSLGWVSRVAREQK